VSGLFASPKTLLHRRDDKALILTSSQALGEPVRAVGCWLEHWAQVTPQRDFLAQRDASGQWRRLTYAMALRQVRALATGLLENARLRPGPVVILSENSIEHALLSLAAMHVGVPVAALSTAYSLASRDHLKLRKLIAELDPGLIYVSHQQIYGAALDAIADVHSAQLVAGAALAGECKAFAELLQSTDELQVQAAFERLGPDALAKILYTSGSTGEPKGVLNTQGMLCSNQQARVQIWPWLQTTPPVILDWLPWSHTFGSNHNFNMVLCNGGTLYIDEGRPMPGQFQASIRNLRDAAPNCYFNVPRGFDMLVAAIEDDDAFARSFFSRVRVLFYAAAALPQNLWDALQRLSAQHVGHPIPMVSAWGTTETAPLATDCHFQANASGNIGVPIPGTRLKLLPVAEHSYEIRVAGLNITPGYFKRAEQTQKAFDAEGFYITGDAVRFAREGDPSAGLIFDGRIAEDFKLSSGTWVNVGNLRIRAVAGLAPLAQDIVIAGHDRDHLGFLVFPNLAACCALTGLPVETPARKVLAQSAVRAAIREGLRKLKQEGGGSSMHAPCAVLLEEPPDIDSGEMTDKGYINQRAVLSRRAEVVKMLFDESDSANAHILRI
tara:strand:- start:2632 stop:4461 length:1830 start_codon:yes stop_codon:yes gene_type:complete